VTTMIALVGEQPIPNLLPVRYLRPEGLVLVYTERTKDVARRLQNLLQDTEIWPLSINDPYDIVAIRDSIHTAVANQRDLIFNLTGGTKTMVLAAYDLATATGSPFLYFQTEGRRGRDLQSLLYRYTFRDGRSYREECATLSEPLITLDDYLRAHFEGYVASSFSSDSGGNLERAVHAALTEVVDEIMAGVRPSGLKDQIEIDLVIRCVNQVGFIEVKGGGEESGKKAVDQLTTSAARELSGIYSARFLVTGASRNSQYKAAATAVNVTVVELCEWRSGARLSQRDAEMLRQRIAEHLPCRRRG
jgi:hypothetical protein